MITFESDYIEGAHPNILKRLQETNLEQESGYGSDIYTRRAIEKIKNIVGSDNVDVILISGGTLTNLIVIENILKPFEGVIAVDSGHINVHEAGAIEKTGHKILTLNNHEGKMNPNELKKYLEDFYNDANHSHAVYPGMVYISYPTEFGTIYTKDELIKIHNICKEYNLPLYLDGARLGYGLMSDSSDITIKDIAAYTDIFCIGGTKVGALIGEALVFNKVKVDHLTTRIKRSGALLAKGRILGIQFDTLFTDNLYFEISKHAIKMANILKNGFIKKGYKLYLDSPTNQQFIIIENSKYEELKSKVGCCFWCKYDDNNTVVRFSTSWATKEENVLKLLDII